MENVWDIRENRGLYYILPEQVIGTESIDYSDVAIIAYIYYEDTVGRYLEYIKDIPSEIAVFLISSNENTLKILNQFKQKKQNIQVIKKRNRGRDVSALLISAKEIFQNYTYVCFVHDKKAKAKEDQRRVDFWIENLWNNTLKSRGYIENVLQVFGNNPNIGLLVPPELYYYMQDSTFWYTEFERTKELAKELGLTHTIIEENCPPITIGTVFWCKADAMKKLFSRQWKFEDFVDEPMPGGETISHAVERILAYVAQDAGYDTGTVMVVEYAKKLLMALQNEKRNFCNMFTNGMNISSLSLWEFYIRKEQIKKYVSDHSEIYLFGAGKRGRFYLTAFREIIGCNPQAFLVTDSTLNEKNINGVPVISFKTLNIETATGIVISVGKLFEDEIKTYLKLKNYNGYLCINDLATDDDLKNHCIDDRQTYTEESI